MLIEEDAWWYYSYDATWYRPLSATSLNISENSTMAVKISSLACSSCVFHEVWSNAQEVSVYLKYNVLSI